jgi:hypothetical protein
LLRSRTLRALIAIGAGIFGAGSVVCASMALTHPSHASPTLASLAPVSGVAATPDARSSATGLLAWHAPTMPAPVALQPRVVRPVRVVVVTRRVARKATPAKARTSGTRPVRRISTPSAARPPGDGGSRDGRTTTDSESRRTSTRTAATPERTDGGDEQRTRDRTTESGDSEREDDR